MQAGQRSRILRFAANDSSTIVRGQPGWNLSSKDRAADHDVRQGNNSTIYWPIDDSPARSDYDEIGDATTERPQS
jgi:hypothetical protein